MQRSLVAFAVMLLLGASVRAQVADIKAASRSSATKGNDAPGRGSGAGFELLNISAHALVHWQSSKLQTRPDNPQIVSLEVIAVAAVQPSSYYIVNPRIRANWGIISSDFRMNYLIEEGVDGVRHLRTNDWQIVQLNIISNRRVNFYVGWGFLQEAFNNGTYFEEWTTALRARPSRKPLSLQIEYRHATPRIECNANIQYPVLERSSTAVYLVGGATFQQYYSSITVWGMQGGVMLKVW